MNFHRKVLVVGVSVAISAAAYAQVDAPSLLKSVQDALSLNRKSNLLSSSPPLPPCAVGSPCRAEATVEELFDRSGKLAACAVRARDIDLTYGANPHGNPHILITWKLVDPTTSPPTGATYIFERPHGVIITRDDGKSTSGKADYIYDKEVQLDHKFKNHNDEVHFYPAVIQTLSDGTQSLCFSGDPRITND